MQSEPDETARTDVGASSSLDALSPDEKRRMKAEHEEKTRQIAEAFAAGLNAAVMREEREEHDAKMRRIAQGMVDGLNSAVSAQEQEHLKRTTD